MPSSKIVKAIDPKTYIYYIPLSKRPPTRGVRNLLEEYSYVHANDIDTHLNTVVRSFSLLLFTPLFLFTPVSPSPPLSKTKANPNSAT
jgi:hypothetical protein